MSSKLIEQIGRALLLIIALSSWLCYPLFTSGTAPGIYPLAVAYSAVMSPLISLAIFFSFPLMPVLAVVALVLMVGALSTRRRFYRRALSIMLIWFLFILVSLPAMISFSPGEQISVKPWNRVYRTAYSTLFIDDNYGDDLLFQCDQTGIFCRQIYKVYDDFSTEQILPLNYDSQRNLFTAGDGDYVVYARSQHKQLCAAVPAPKSSAIKDYCPQAPALSP